MLVTKLILNNVKIVLMESIVHMIVKNAWIIFITQLIRKLVLQTANMIVHIWQTFIHVSTLVAMHPK